MFALPFFFLMPGILLTNLGSLLLFFSGARYPRIRNPRKLNYEVGRTGSDGLCLSIPG